MPRSRSRWAKLATACGAAAATFVMLSTCTPTKAQAQGTTFVPPFRSTPWKTVTGVAAVSVGFEQLLMPRIFYPEPEVTVGWKARWHVSVLAPVMTIAAMSLFNEMYFKDAIKAHRPNCTDDNQGLVDGCLDYGGPSTHTFAAASYFGHGLGVFLVDTFKYNDGRVNAFSVIGNIGYPLVAGIVTFVGRGVGNWEKPGENITGALIGLGTGLLLGTMYAEMQRPECGYSGALVCW
jgi:hypothetical protein